MEKTDRLSSYKKVFFLLRLFLVSFGILLCTTRDQVDLWSHYKMSPEAFSYLNVALNIIQTNFYKTKDINWPKIRLLAYDVAMLANTPRETHPAIRVVISQLHENHSSFWEKDQFEQFFSTDTEQLPTGYMIDSQVAYINFPGTIVTDAGQQQAYALRGQQLIRKLDNGGICGWIVDLRSETGGNMGPILAGIGPVLGEGHVGSFLLNNGNRMEWFYEQGQVKVDKTVMIDISSGMYDLQHPYPQVAVLTGHLTNSAGEAIVVAFRGRDKTRFFGGRTHGFPTGNQSFVLQDQAVIVLTTAYEADRTGQIYEGEIIPDEVIDPVEGTDVTIEAASIWLLSQPECR
jgi:carboxyl-terminal processing protease